MQSWEVKITATEQGHHSLRSINTTTGHGPEPAALFCVYTLLARLAPQGMASAAEAFLLVRLPDGLASSRAAR